MYGNIHIYHPLRLKHRKLQTQNQCTNDIDILTNDIAKSIRIKTSDDILKLLFKSFVHAKK